MLPNTKECHAASTAPPAPGPPHRQEAVAQQRPVVAEEARGAFHVLVAVAEADAQLLAGGSWGLLLAMPGATFVASCIIVAMPFVPSSFLLPTCDGL